MSESKRSTDYLVIKMSFKGLSNFVPYEQLHRIAKRTCIHSPYHRFKKNVSESG